jgi:hypothetical protein
LSQFRPLTADWPGGNPAFKSVFCFVATTNLQWRSSRITEFLWIVTWKPDGCTGSSLQHQITLIIHEKIQNSSAIDEFDFNNCGPGWRPLVQSAQVNCAA